MATTSSASTRHATPASGLTDARPWWKSVAGAVPNLIAFSALGAVFFMGHQSGWKLPKLSQLLGAVDGTKVDWCEEHLVPESICIECREDMLPKPQSFGYCQIHGVAECVLHHPELAQVKGEPRLPQYDVVPALALMARPENNSRNSLHLRRVQFASSESVSKSGVEVAVVEERPMTEAITANGELQFDPTRVAHLSSRAAGSVALVFKTPGDKVEPGDMLALIDAAQVGQIKAQLLQSIVQLQLRQANNARLRSIASSGSIPQRSVVEADAALQEAEIAFITARQALANLGYDVPGELEKADAKRVAEQLQFLGVPAGLIGSLPPGAKTGNLIPILAPHAGMIVSSEIVAGEVVDISRTLFTVADPSRLWLLLNVRQEHAKLLRDGQTVRFRTDDGNHSATGTIAWISPAVDEHSRTLQVRIAIKNEDGGLRDKTFGSGQIILREEPNAVVVPRDALHSSGDAHFIFVRDKNYFAEGTPKFFHVRQVRTGASDDQFVELLAGVLPGEVIASQGSTILMSQLMRSELGAGCGCHDQ